MWVYVMAIPSGRPAGRRGKNFNVGYISLNIRGRLLIFGVHIDHMDLYPPDLYFHGSLISVIRDWPR